MKPILLASAMLLMLLPKIVMAEVIDATAPVSTLEISAQSDIKAAPDIATISAGVLTSAPTADVAMQSNAKQMTAVFDALKKMGVNAKDIQSTGIAINPMYHYPQNEQPKITGYQATNTVSIVLRNLNGMGAVLDALVGQGVNQLNGPTFAIEDTDALLDKVRADAVRKARQRAEIYATAAGMNIKRILSISESTGYAPPPPSIAMDSAETAETPVAPGEVALNVTLNVTFELVP